jgi:hypothetical protein
MIKFILFFSFLALSLPAMETQILNKGKALFSEDFSKSIEIKKPHWWVKQNTRWSVKNGQLLGIPATLVYQAKKKKEGKGHLGDIPRIGLAKIPKSYIMTFKFQMDDKAWNKQVPMFEFGHHVSRIFFSKEGAKLLSDHEKVTNMEDKNLIPAPFKWYEVLAEVGETDLFIQIKDENGKLSKFYCHYPKFKEAENTNFQIATTVQGTVKMDNFKVWQSKGLKDNWQEAVKSFK